MKGDISNLMPDWSREENQEYGKASACLPSILHSVNRIIYAECDGVAGTNVMCWVYGKWNADDDKTEIMEGRGRVGLTEWVNERLNAGTLNHCFLAIYEGNFVSSNNSIWSSCIIVDFNNLNMRMSPVMHMSSSSSYIPRYTKRYRIRKLMLMEFLQKQLAARLW